MKLGAKIMSVLIAVILLIEGLPVKAFATEVPAPGESTEYVKDLTLIYSNNPNEARAQLEAAGYIFLNANLNEGTGEKGVYMGYKITTDPKEAITDIKLMNMKGGYSTTSKKEILKQQGEVIAKLAEEFYDIGYAFKLNYWRGQTAALKAYEALNFFRLKENEGSTPKEEDGLGYAIINDNFGLQAFTELLLFGNTAVLETVIKLLSLGATVDGGDWLTKLSLLGPYDPSFTYSPDPQDLKLRSEDLLNTIRVYSKIYNIFEKSGTYDKPTYDKDGKLIVKEYPELTAEEMSLKNANLPLADMYKLAFDSLENYKWGEDKTLKDFFCSLETMTKSDAKQLYPLVYVLSDAEFASLGFGAILEMILGVNAKDSDFELYDEVLESVSEGLTMYLWEGVDAALIEKNVTIGFTAEADRHMADTGETEFYSRESEYLNDFAHRRNIAIAIGTIGLGILGISKVGMGISMTVLGVETATAAMEAIGFWGGCFRFFSCLAGWGATYIVAIVAAVVLLYSIVRLIIDWHNEQYPDLSKYPIPDYMYDVKSDDRSHKAFVMYKVIDEFGKDKAADLNAYSGKQWLAVYVSRDGKSGKPVEADFIVKKGNGTVPDDYTPLSEYGEVYAKNLNDYDRHDSVSGVYVFFKQDKEAAVSSDSVFYLQDIYMVSGESTGECINKLERQGYTPINVNLTPGILPNEDTKVDTGSISIMLGAMNYTYIGYKVTTSPASAIRDIRLAYGCTVSPYYNGEISYGLHGTSGDVSLYASTNPASGTPILADSLLVVNHRNEAPEGYEPVNLFSGGPAANINASGLNVYAFSKLLKTYGGVGVYLYFLPETTFTEGPDYLSGIAYFSSRAFYSWDIASKFTPGPFVTLERSQKIMKNITGIADFDFDNIRNVRSLMYFIFDNLIGYEHKIGLYSTFESSAYFCYSTTKNPYRAIYGVIGSDRTNLGQNVKYGTTGYSATPSYIVQNSALMTYITVADQERMNATVFVAGNKLNNTYDEQNGKMTKAQPLLASEILITASRYSTTIPENFKPLTDAFGTEDSALKLREKELETYATFYVISDENAKKQYVSNIQITDKGLLFSQYRKTYPDISAGQITDSLAFSTLANMGAMKLCKKTYTPDKMNTVYFGYTMTDSEDAALKDLFLYCEAFSRGSPEEEMYKNGFKYTLLGEINAFVVSGVEDTLAPRIYLYGTTDRRAGSPIVEINISSLPLVKDYTTVRTVDGLDMLDSLKALTKKEKNSDHIVSGTGFITGWNKYFSSNDSNPNIYINYKSDGDSISKQKPFISEIVIACEESRSKALSSLVSQGADLFVDQDLNEFVKWREGHYILVGYKLTSDPDNAITGLAARYGKNPPSSATANGIEYDLVANIDLKKHAFGEYIYLYSTKDPAAGDPLVSLNISRSNVAESLGGTLTDKVVKQLGSSSYADFNKGSGYVYLYMHTVSTSDKTPGTYKEIQTFKNPEEDVYTPYGSEKGKYISGIYIMDKNTIRQEKLAQGVKSSDCECEDISDSEVIARLKEMGAAEIVDGYISANQTGIFTSNNHNKIFIGVTRTNIKSKAIRSIMLYTDMLSNQQPDNKIYDYNYTYYLVTGKDRDGNALPAINLLGIEDGQGALNPSVYLYVGRSGSEEPIRDIVIDSVPIKNGWKTSLTQNSVTVYTDITKQAQKAHDVDNDAPYSFNGASTFAGNAPTNYQMAGELVELFKYSKENITPWFIHTKHFDGESNSEKLPYIGNIYIAAGSNKTEAIASLLEQGADHYIDTDANKKAGGDYVYIGFKRTDGKAGSAKPITDLLIFEGKNPAMVKQVTNSDISSVYTLVKNVDLNKDAGGKYLYLYAATDTAAGRPLTDLYISEGSKINTNAGNISYSTVRKGEASGGKNVITSEQIDLNKKAGGKYLYLIQARDLSGTYNGNVSSNPGYGALVGEGSVTVLVILGGIAAIGLGLMFIARKKRNQI